ncbi:MAG: hypothetical protein AMQ22_01766 [Candidatus Methanofastidiosum methylothiophilum]|uniref:YspA cpYpsA-related SLOG domain-containing protein n=1 Tax=Candidatus Methanofastidiosum methylothiophilum TaxID=1705564 RepID=A0A150IVG9_9EURY|nr:MAG: hypothetical protein AMQ22_01766 [Candidatus Methanofastidiosum methylthiophilus]
MKFCVSGSRTIKDYHLIKAILDGITQAYDVSYICAGGAVGVDKLVEQYALENNIKFEEFPADWDTYHSAAGVIRNMKMVDWTHKTVAIWDGKSKGTKSAIDYANRVKKLLFVYEV